MHIYFTPEQLSRLTTALGFAPFNMSADLVHAVIIQTQAAQQAAAKPPAAPDVAQQAMTFPEAVER